MQILLKSFYDINNEIGAINDIDISTTTILDNYIEETVKFTLNESKKSQSYELQRPTNEVFAIVKELFRKEFSHDYFNNGGRLIADMLLDSELQLRGAAKAKQGALIQSLIKATDTNYYFVILKNEFFKAINRNNLELIEAFLYDESKKTPLKVCIFDLEYDTINDDISINDIKIDDSISSDHADYWYNVFLSMKKCKTDVTNTKNAMSGLVNFWAGKLKENPTLMMDVRNETISYFRQNETFDIDTYRSMVSNIDEEVEEIVHDVFDNYIEENSAEFENTFNIDASIVKSYRKTYSNYKIKEGLTLQVKNISISNIVYRTTDGQDEFLLIKTDNQELLNNFERLNI